VLADELGISRKAATATLHRLAEVGILEQRGTLNRAGPGQPAALFISRELLGLVGSNPLR
jgi:predicted ArsR family transcriptional regulator